MTEPFSVHMPVTSTPMVIEMAKKWPTRRLWPLRPCPGDVKLSAQQALVSETLLAGQGSLPLRGSSFITQPTEHRSQQASDRCPRSGGPEGNQPSLHLLPTVCRSCSVRPVLVQGAVFWRDLYRAFFLKKDVKWFTIKHV